MENYQTYLKYTLDFIVQTYMFKPIEDQGTINDIFVNFYLYSDAWRDKNASSTFTSAVVVVSES